MLSPGQDIDRYVVEAHLGTGGMAEVYRVRHKTTDGLHALKVLKSGNPSVRDRLLQEARVQAAMRHPNVVAVTDVIDVQGAPGLVMEYVDGPTLLDWLDQDHPDLQTRLDLFRAVLRGVGRAHELGIVHRDLSPHNVLVQRTRHGPHPKVTDFGIAKDLDPGRSGPHHTRAGRPMGTPAFMSPEQVRDASDVDHRTDIWALGALLHLLVTDRLAFDGADVLEIFNKVAEGRYEALPEGLPTGIVATIQGCLTVDRQRRLQDCAAVEATLDTVRPAVATRPTPPRTLLTPPARPAPAPPAPAPPLPAPPAPARSPWPWVLGGLLLAVAGALAAAVLLSGGDPEPGGDLPEAAAVQASPVEPAPAQPTLAAQPAAAPAEVAARPAAAAAEVAAQPAAAAAQPAGAPAHPAAAPPAADAAAVAAAAEEAAQEAAPAATPAAPAPDAAWTLEGDARSACLTSRKSKGCLPPGPVNSGSYSVVADLGSGSMSAGTVSIGAGQSVTVVCEAAKYSCQQR